MTTSINVPIRPGAALADPETRAFVEENIINAKFDLVTRHSWIPDRVYNKEGIVNVLANYPWHEYGYKFGRWRRELVIDELPFIPWRSWKVNHEFMVLTDPVHGHEISLVTAIRMNLRGPAGRLLFAGDPYYAGVISTITAGTRHISIVGSIRLGGGSSAVSGKASDLTKVMAPGRPPQAQLFNLSDKYMKLLGPWIADHPEKPAKRDRF